MGEDGGTLAGPPRRVAITGIGVVSPIGSGVADFWAGAMAGRSAVREITCFDATPFRSRIAAELDDVPLEHWVAPKRARWIDRYSALGIVAGLQALQDAGLSVPLDGLGERTGVYLGSALGGVSYGEAQHRAFLERGMRAVDPSLALSVFGGAASTNLAMELGVHGPNLANANSCASGAIAIGEAFRLIRAGGAELMLAGGAEAPLSPLAFGAFAVIRALSERNEAPQVASRPFDRERDGFVMAEGAGILVLEEWEQAERRGARVYAEIVGYGTTNDAYHMTAPRPDGSQARRCMQLAIADAHLGAEEIGLVSAHASSTVLGDRAEALALDEELGTQRPLIFATKGAHGHALGATPAWETALLALALQRGCAPPTTNFARPDEDVCLALTGPEPCPIQARYGLKNAFGFGGINACLVLAAPPIGAMSGQV
jgi:3-oxoacyl-[acyl-carrier-protein] synthase II